MHQNQRRTLRLPHHLLDEIGDQSTNRTLKSRGNGPGLRKDRRKAARIQKKIKDPVVRAPLGQKNNGGVQKIIAKEVKRPEINSIEVESKPLRSMLKNSKVLPSSGTTPKLTDSRTPPPSPPPRPSKDVQDRLAADDAEIAALEKALGIKKSKKLPKSFEGDGLDVLLEDLSDTSADDAVSNGKRKRSEEAQWLKYKRQKAPRPYSVPAEDTTKTVLHHQVVHSNNEASTNRVLQDMHDSYQGFSDDESFEEDFSDGTPFSVPIAQKVRENPYVAPATTLGVTIKGKYVPPSAREKGSAPSGDLSRLRRRMQGLLNRLSEANLLALLKDFEALYRDNPRQDVTSTLLDLLVDLLADPSSLQDTFIILHAGFIAALYKTIGSEFGAQAISRIDDHFKRLYESKGKEGPSSKKLTNLINLLAYLYNFRVIGSGLIYDLIRLFIEDLSETNTELLLKLTRSKKDDAGSLKAINQLLQSSVTKNGSQNMSVRTNFMVETINGLAGKGIKTGVADSIVSTEHIVRMKGILGSLNERNVKASEPLGISLKDLRETERRGKWWLVGASFKDDDRQTKGPAPSQRRSVEYKNEHGIDGAIDAEADLSQLARRLGMNTDVRRAIFVTVMCSDDYNIAYKRLQKLNLNSSQKLEIPRVLIRCSSAQESYNPFFTLLARRLICAEAKMGKVFQYSMWNLLNRMSEENGEEEEDGMGEFELRSILNLARLFGVLIAEDGLSLRILKGLHIACLPGLVQDFVELLFITIILHSQRDLINSRDEAGLIEIFLKPKEISDMAQGLRYFLKRVVSKTDIVGGRADRETVKWGCKVARDALKAASASAVAVQ